MSDAIKHITDDIFLPGRQRIDAYALCMQRSPTAAALSTFFLLNHAPNSPELPLDCLQDLGSPTAAYES